MSSEELDCASRQSPRSPLRLCTVPSARQLRPSPNVANLLAEGKSAVPAQLRELIDLSCSSRTWLNDEVSPGRRRTRSLGTSASSCRPVPALIQVVSLGVGDGSGGFQPCGCWREVMVQGSCRVDCRSSTLWLAARNCTDPSMPVRAHRLVRPELIETAVLTTAQRCAQTASSDVRRGGCRRGGCRRGGQPRADGRKSRQ
jgi:hypothetical protein